MTTADLQAGWSERLVDHHDYIWARLPFLVPMALAVARRRGDDRAHAIADALLALHPIVLDHLAREERALALHSARAIRDRLHDDHVAVNDLLARLREEAAAASAAGQSSTPTERELFAELVLLDTHIAAQIALEERLLGLS